jgi:hypothetical protein
MAENWGNPALKSFKNNYIRRVMVDQARVFVHKNIVSQVEELLLRSLNNGAVFSNSHLPIVLPAYQMDDSSEASMGLKLQVPNFASDIDVTDLGFTQIGDVFVYDTGAEVEMPSHDDRYVDEAPTKIGSRQITLGTSGDDVKFLAYFFGMDGAVNKRVFDDEMLEHMNFFQKRMGVPQTKMLDWYTWNTILPKGAERIAAGYAGAKVRVLQSALRVYGYNCPVTSRFGTETIKTVREFQVANNLRVTGRVGFLEWNLFFELK